MDKTQREAVTVASFLLFYGLVLAVLLIGRQWLTGPVENAGGSSEPTTSAATLTPANP